MSLQRGFLRRNKYRFNRQFIFTSILLTLINALVWYYLLILVKEVIRILTFSLNGYLLILTSKENYFYNWFYANVALIIGLGVGVKFLFDSSQKTQNLPNRVTRSFISSNQEWQIWNYILWFTKVFLSLGFIAMGMPFIYLDIDFLKEFYYFFILFIVVWYLNIWLGFYRLRRRKLYLIPIVLFVVIQIVAGLMAFNDVVDIDQINKNLKSQIISVKYQIAPPQLKSFRYKDLPSKNFDVYVGWEKEYDSDRENLIVLKDESRGLTEKQIKDMQNYLEEEIKLWGSSIGYFRMTLHADRSVRLEKINKIREIASKIGITSIFYATLPNNKQILPKDYSMYERYGLLETIYNDCSQAIDIIDSLQLAGIGFKQLKFPAHYCYRGIKFKNKNRIKISVDKNLNLFLNHLATTESQLENFSYQFIKKFNGEGLFLCDFDPNISYEQYIKIKTLVFRSLFKIRKEVARQLFNIEYPLSGRNPGIYTDERIQIIELLYPDNIIELTETDKYLYEFSKKR